MHEHNLVVGTVIIKVLMGFILLYLSQAFMGLECYDLLIDGRHAMVDAKPRPNHPHRTFAALKPA
jgi:hypothetical protein